MNRCDTPGAETASVAYAVYLIKNGPGPVTGLPEITVQGVQALSGVDGAKGRCQGLSQNLAAKYMFGVVVLAAKEVFLNGFHVQKIDDFLQDLVHKYFAGVGLRMMAAA